LNVFKRFFVKVMINKASLRGQYHLNHQLNIGHPDKAAHTSTIQGHIWHVHRDCNSVSSVVQ